MLDWFVDEFLANYLNLMAWTAVGLLIGAFPYLLVSRRRPDLRRLARGIYAGVALGAAFLVGGSVDLVPSDETDVGPVIESGRIERPLDGFAVTFPVDWTVQEVSSQYNEEVTARTDGEGLMTAIVVGFDADAGAGCTLFDTTLLVREAGWPSVEALVDGTKAEAIDLPAGAASRSDLVEHDGRPGTQYTFEEDGEWFFLGCYADDPPGDRWLSVAETFEFLPAGE